jgi:hypothetical protein
MLKVIPKEHPRLQLNIYSKIFEHFLEIKDYESFKDALVSFPNYMIDQDLLIESIKAEIEKDKTLNHN